MSVDCCTAFKAVRTSMNDNFALRLFYFCACFAKLIQVICDPVAFFIAKVLYIVESRGAVCEHSSCYHGQHCICSRIAIKLYRTKPPVAKNMYDAVLMTKRNIHHL
ncbi:hypothetical protein D3C78_1383150 [compost metagenome]